MKSKYDEIIIQKLEFPDNVRTRPGMYIGETNNANILLREIIDNSIDELYSVKSPCNKIFIHDTGKYHVVIDNGRGLPIRKSLYDENITMAYESISSLHSGSKFAKTESAIGQNGVGSAVCSALSTEYHVWSKITSDKLTRTTNTVKKLCKGKDIADLYYHVETSKGLLVKEEVNTRSEIEEFLGIHIEKDSMTIVSFSPDESIFDSRSADIPETIKFVKYIVETRGKDSKIYYNGNEVLDQFSPFKYSFDCIIKSKNPESKNPKIQFLCSLELDENEMKSFNQVGSINGLIVNSGYHIKLSDWAFDLALSKKYNKDFKGYSRWGLHMSTIVMAPEPSFSSQTKERCSGIPGIDVDCLGPLVDEYYRIIEENSQVFDAHVLRVLNYISTLKNLSKIDYIRSKIILVSETVRSNSWTPVNLKDCTTKNRSNAELFIVEGKSAAGGLISSRDVKIHAILSLRGKPLNTTELKVEELLENQEMKDVINSIGCGIDDYHNTSEIRYGKVIILADSDSDGANITSLVLGLFASHMKFLIEEGFIYICKTPLYAQKVGKSYEYYYEGEESNVNWNKHVIRLKGLGSANPEDLREFALNKSRRRLTKVTIDGVAEGLRLLSSTAARTQLLIDAGNIQEGYTLKNSMIEIKNA